MITVQVKLTAPEGEYYYAKGGEDALDPDSDYGLRRAEEAGVDVIVYSYGSGSYEGHGNALLRKDGMWALENLNHCSCYGPLDEIPDKFEPLGSLLARMSSELLDEVQPLVDEVFKRGLDLI
jgi:hypothetical protein